MTPSARIQRLTPSCLSAPSMTDQPLVKAALLPDTISSNCRPAGCDEPRVDSVSWSCMAPSSERVNRWAWVQSDTRTLAPSSMVSHLVSLRRSFEPPILAVHTNGVPGWNGFKIPDEVVVADVDVELPMLLETVVVRGVVEVYPCRSELIVVLTVDVLGVLC